MLNNVNFWELLTLHLFTGAFYLTIKCKKVLLKKPPSIVYCDGKTLFNIQSTSNAQYSSKHYIFVS